MAIIHVDRLRDYLDRLIGMRSLGADKEGAKDLEEAIDLLNRIAEYCKKEKLSLCDRLPTAAIPLGPSANLETQNKHRGSANRALDLVGLRYRKLTDHPLNKLEEIVGGSAGARLQPPPGETGIGPTGKEKADRPAPSEVRTGELGRHLGFYRRVTGVAERQLLERIKDRQRKPHGPDDWFLPPDVSVVAFEDGKHDEAVELHRLKHFLTAYNDDDEIPNDMPQLIAEWLVSTPVQGPLVHQRFGQFRSAYGDDEQHWAGKHCHYKIPRQRLAGTDCAFVTFHLDPVPQEIVTKYRPLTSTNDENDEKRLSLRNLDDVKLRDLIPHSIPHQHPGDEILFVLHGAVFVELDDTGGRARLMKHDYMHFNAETPHSVWNVSCKEPATVLVIRFFQLSRLGNRRRREDDLREILSGLDTKFESTQEWPRGSPAAHGRKLAEIMSEVAARFDFTYSRYLRIAPWLHSLLDTPQKRAEDEPDQILDILGLSNILRLLILTHESEASFPKELLRKSMGPSRKDLTAEDGDQLNDAFKALANRITTQKPSMAHALSRYLRGQRPAPEPRGLEVLELFANYFNIPRVLLDNALVPPVQRCVVIRNNHRDRIKPPRYTRQDEGVKARYRLPCRALANSDISITVLTLEHGGACRENSHLGYELLVCLDGCVSLEMDGKPPVKCEENEYVHYRSRYSHQVRNVDEGHSEVLVIRFNEDDGSEEAKLLPPGLRSLPGH
jgi:quercetin dioxygenase-like cupin family protein